MFLIEKEGKFKMFKCLSCKNIYLSSGIYTEACRNVCQEASRAIGVFEILQENVQESCSLASPLEPSAGSFRKLKALEVFSCSPFAKFDHETM